MLGSIWFSSFIYINLDDLNYIQVSKVIKLLSKISNTIFTQLYSIWNIHYTERYFSIQRQSLNVKLAIYHLMLLLISIYLRTPRCWLVVLARFLLSFVCRSSNGLHEVPSVLLCILFLDHSPPSLPHPPDRNLITNLIWIIIVNTVCK